MSKWRVITIQMEDACEAKAMSEKTIKGNDLARGERLQVMLDDAELQALDDFRFSNRMPSRASAVRELLRRGLQGVGYAIHPGAKSGSYGVMNGAGDDGKEPSETA